MDVLVLSRTAAPVTETGDGLLVVARLGDDLLGHRFDLIVAPWLDRTDPYPGGVEWWQEQVLTRLNPGGKIVIT